jgi:potassium/hydrogen antiporter
MVKLQRLFGARETHRKTELVGFGEFVFDADTPARDLALLYGLPIDSLLKAETTDAYPPIWDETLGDLLHQRLGKTLVVGDRLELGDVELVVREVQNGRASSVGLELETRRQRLQASRFVDWLLRQIGVRL